MGRESIRIATGKYTGESSNLKIVSGLGFQPTLILVWAGNGSTPVCWKQPADQSRNLSCALTTSVAALTTAILHPTDDGFAVGVSSYVNNSGVGYYWMAVRAPRDVIFGGGYTGTGAGHNVTDPGLGFVADWMWCMTNVNGVSSAYAKLNDATADSFILGAAAKFTDAITNIISGGMTLGVGTGVNTSARQYHYMAAKNVATCIASGTTTGTGAATDINVGFSPDVIIIKNASTADSGVIVSSRMQTDGVQPAKITGTGAGGAVATLTASGFSLTSNATVNGSGNKIAWFAFKAGDFAVGATRATA